MRLPAVVGWAQPVALGSRSRPAAAARRAGGGQELRLVGEFATLSAVLFGGTAANWSYSNSGDTSAVTVTTPPHAPRVVSIELRAMSGGSYSKTNAFAYLPTVFTDDTLMAGATIVKAQHLVELRQAVDALRAVARLAPPQRS